MAITERKRLGNSGEKLAEKFLKKNGYKILNKNFKCPFGEVDIVAAKDGTVAFIEVKARTTDAFGTPSEAVDFNRKSRYINCARFYFSGMQVNYNVRFDVIEVYKDKIEHLENAFWQ